ncbi:hypothetical protein [Arthrobacter sp. 9MFCol3.1]|uniref:hypothetical protein n=1 Tax=Arthrobacter sp. 9MFCol3.1 TaxID=1150398 RepID=UPI00047C28C4|nr:hypothetical protein [Arthrobacter sp. 9MFCol3.1]
MKDVTCPYCDHDFDLSHDDGAFYDQDRAEECECPNCEKYFMVSSSIIWEHEAHKADCLNGGEHDWKPMLGYPKEYFADRERCDACDAERKVEAAQ